MDSWSNPAFRTSQGTTAVRLPVPARKEAFHVKVKPDLDLLTRTSWSNARIGLSEIYKGRAHGNKPALWLRMHMQHHLYHLGCSIHRHAGKVLFVGLLLLSAFCVGLRSAKIETDINNLWVQAGGRLSLELKYVKDNLGEGTGSTSQILIQTPKRQGANTLTKEALLIHLEAALVATQVEVNMYDTSWKLKDLCYSPPPPIFGDYNMDDILQKLFPCVIITPLDCFWEGSKLLGPWRPITMPLYDGSLSWTKLHPEKLVKEMENLVAFPQATALRDFLHRAGITAGYQEKSCIDPLDPECPDTAPNKISGKHPDFGAELTGGCHGFATKYMHWPEELLVGGIKKNKTGYIVRAEAFQSLIELMGEQNIFEFYQNHYKVHQVEWSIEKARSILVAWQEEFSQTIEEHLKTENTTMNENIYVYASETSLDKLMNSFADISFTRILAGYLLMLIYSCVSLLRWTDAVKSQSGVGVAGVLLVTVAVAAGLGLCSLLRIPFNATTTQVAPADNPEMWLEILPFLALGLGMNDMFLLAYIFSELTGHSFILEKELLGEGLKRMGISVLLSSFSSSLAFFFAAIIPIPALRAFCLQAGILVLFNLFVMIFLFPAVVSIDNRRRDAGRVDIFCCFEGSKNKVKELKPCSALQNQPFQYDTPKSLVTSVLPGSGKCVLSTVDLENMQIEGESFPANGNSLSTQNLTDEEKRPLRDRCAETQRECCSLSITWFAREHYGFLLEKCFVKFLVVLTFLVLIGAAIWGISKIDEGLDLTDLVPRHSSEWKFLDTYHRYFDFYHMFAVTKGNFDYPKHQQLLYDYHDAFNRVGQIIKNDDGGLPEFWLTYFRDWLIRLQQAFDRDWRDGSITQEKWFANASHEGILAYKLLVQTGDIDNPIMKSNVNTVRLVNSNGIIYSKAFYNYLTAWVSHDVLAYSASMAHLSPTPRDWHHEGYTDYELLIPKSPPLTFTQLPFSLHHLGDTSATLSLIKQVRGICDKFEEKGLPNFVIGTPFTFWEQYLYLRYFLTIALTVTSVVIFIIITITLMNPWMASLVVFIIVSMVLELFGLLGILGIKLSAIPAVMLIVTVGIGVEFTVHICLGFVTSIGTRNRRMCMSLEHMMAPVVHGALSTLVGVLMLAFSEFDFIVRYFFYTLIALVFIGLANGLIFLPVLLSIIGPPGEIIPKDGPNRICIPTPEPSPPREQAPKMRQISRRIHPHHATSDISLSTITEEPQSYQSAHEIIVQPEVVVETVYPQNNRAQHNTSPVVQTLPNQPSRHYTTVTAKTKVKVEVHSPLPGAVETKEQVRKHKRRQDNAGSSSSSSGASDSGERGIRISEESDSDPSTK